MFDLIFSRLICGFLFLQRLEALKKVYADVILNTSKEAAAKVMAAQKKAQQLEHKLRCTKEEAVQMMVRLKKKMDDEV